MKKIFLLLAACSLLTSAFAQNPVTAPEVRIPGKAQNQVRRIQKPMTGVLFYRLSDSTMCVRNPDNTVTPLSGGAIGDYSPWDTTTTAIIEKDTTKNVGIGTTTPVAKLHVEGNTLLGTSGTDTIYTNNILQIDYCNLAADTCMSAEFKKNKIQLVWTNGNYTRQLKMDGGAITLLTTNPDGTEQSTQQTINATNQTYSIGALKYISGIFHDTTGSAFPFCEMSIFNDTLFGSGADEASIQLHKDGGHPHFEWQLQDTDTDTTNTTNIHAHGQLRFDNDNGYKFVTPDSFIVDAGKIQVPQFAGSAQKIVTADATGVLDTATVTSISPWKKSGSDVILRDTTNDVKTDTFITKAIVGNQAGSGGLILLNNLNNNYIQNYSDIDIVANEGDLNLHCILGNVNMILPAFDNDAAAAALNPGDLYQTTGSGAAPLNVAGIVMIKQ